MTTIGGDHSSHISCFDRVLSVAEIMQCIADTKYCYNWLSAQKVSRFSINNIEFTRKFHF